MTTVISGCARCRRLVCRGAAGDPWREVRRGGLLLPGDAVRCPARDDGGPHEAPDRALLTAPVTQKSGTLTAPRERRGDDTTKEGKPA
jgi:hypothetical protein